MKKLALALVFLLSASAAFAATAWMHLPSSQVSWFRPSSVTIDGRRYEPPTDGQLAEAGYLAVEFDDVYGDLRYRVISWDPPAIRAFTPEEKAAADLADAEAQAELEAQAKLPMSMPTGIEVPWVVFLDATNRQVGIAMELATNNVPIYYEFHASPVDWKKVDANRKAALSAASLKEKDSADAISYAKDKAAKDKIAKAEAVAATNGKEPTDKEKIALMWKHYLSTVGAEKK